MNVDIGVTLDEITPALAAYPSAQNAFVKSVLARAAVRVKHSAPQATSQMTNAIRHAMTSETTGEIVVGTNYAGYVHNGRDPGGVDLAAIQDWAKVKGLPDGAAYPIAQSIARNGVEPQPWITDYTESSDFRNMVNRVFNREMNNAMA